MKLFTNILFFCYLSLSISIVIQSQSNNSNDNQDINFVYSEKLFPKVNLRDAKGSIELWTRELAADMKIAYSFNNEFIKGISTVEDEYIDKDIDLIVMSALEYLMNYKKLRSLNPIVITADKGVIGVEYLILTHKENNVKAISDLKNRSISFIDDYSNAIPQIWLDVILKKNKLPLSSKFFKNIVVSINANQAILKTFFKQVEACIVPKNLYEYSVEINPQLDNDLVILEQSDPYIVGVFCANKKMDDDFRRNLIQSAIKALENTKGKQFSLFFRVGEVIEYKSEHIKSLKKLLADAVRYNINLDRN